MMRCDVQASANTQWLIPVTLCSRSGFLETQTLDRQSHFFPFPSVIPMARNKNSCEKCQYCSGGSIPDTLLMLEVYSRAWQETGEHRAACVFCLLCVYFGGRESLVIRLETHCGLFLWTCSTSRSTSGLFVLSKIFPCLFTVLIFPFHLCVL